MVFDLLDTIVSVVSAVSAVSDILNIDDCQPEQFFAIDTPEISPEIAIDDGFSTLSSLTLLMDDNPIDSDLVRFGDSSEIQLFEQCSVGSPDLWG